MDMVKLGKVLSIVIPALIGVLAVFGVNVEVVNVL